MFDNNIIWVLLVGLAGIWIAVDFVQAIYSVIKGESQEEDTNHTETQEESTQY